MSKLNELFEQKLHVVNFGIESFYDDLTSQKVDAVHVDWKPVAGGDKAAAASLRKLKKPELAAKIEAANKEALGPSSPRSRRSLASPSRVTSSPA
ncbi:MAG: hypothetical protein R2881_07480 [Eubacteriales bacterium]